MGYERAGAGSDAAGHDYQSLKYESVRDNRYSQWFPKMWITKRLRGRRSFLSFTRRPGLRKEISAPSSLKKPLKALALEKNFIS